MTDYILRIIERTKEETAGAFTCPDCREHHYGRCYRVKSDEDKQ